MCDHEWVLVSKEQQEINHYSGTTTFVIEVYQCTKCGAEKSVKYRL